MGAGKEGRHPYPFPFDASEVVGREPGSVATRLGEQRRRPRGTGPLSRFGGKAQGAGRIPFYIVFLVFQCILICFSFLTPFSIYSYQLNDLYS